MQGSYHQVGISDGVEGCVILRADDSLVGREVALDSDLRGHHRSWRSPVAQVLK